MRQIAGALSSAHQTPEGGTNEMWNTLNLVCLALPSGARYTSLVLDKPISQTTCEAVSSDKWTKLGDSLPACSSDTSVQVS